MSRLYLIRGLPGSGKSTKAKTLDAVHYEADMFHVKNGVYRFDPNKKSEAHIWCQTATKNALMAGEDVVVSNTFTTVQEMRPYFFIADDLGDSVQVITMNGDYGNIHDVPTDVINMMRNRWEWFPDGVFYSHPEEAPNDPQ